MNETTVREAVRRIAPRMGGADIAALVGPVTAAWNGSWDARRRVLSTMDDPMGVESAAGGAHRRHTPDRWLAAVDVDAGWAADAVRHSRHPQQTRPLTPAARAFPALTSLDADPAQPGPTMSAAPPPRRRPGRAR